MNDFIKPSQILSYLQGECLVFTQELIYQSKFVIVWFYSVCGSV